MHTAGGSGRDSATTPRGAGRGVGSVVGGPGGLADLGNTVREQMSTFFGRPLSGVHRAAPAAETPTKGGRLAKDIGSATGGPAIDSGAKNAVSAAIAQSAAATGATPADVSPSNSLSEALNLDDDDVNLTFAGSSGAGSAEKSSPRPAASPAAAAEGTPEAAPDGRGADRPRLARLRADSAPGGKGCAGTQQSVASSHKEQNTHTSEAFAGSKAEGPSEEGLVQGSPSSASMVAGLRQLLSEDARLSQVLAERRDAVRERTGAGLVWVDSLGPASLLAVAATAAAALAWGRGSSLALGLLWLFREHGSDVVAGACMALLVTKMALAAHLDTRFRAFVEGIDELQASVRAVHEMQQDVHTMRTIIETMQEDMEAKTAWIPKGIAPPTWLPGQKRNS